MGQCQSINAQPGEGCFELAQRCRISQYDFDRFNPNVCGNIYVGMRMCCTEPVCCLSPPSSRRRTVPPPPTIELSPPPPAGGSCETYTVKGGDTCEDIASAFGVSEDGLDRINVFTSGWGGCSALVDGTVICVKESVPDDESELRKL